ncbi:MAG: hypothetical protein K8M05_31970, partial [Deltaproteobacteria bacterium]|nr:hypothetical protein [Kofleriaceae bacterium]
APMSRELAGEALDRLESRVGATLLPGVREDVLASGNLGNVRITGVANLYHPLPRAELLRVFGEGAWIAFERRMAGEGAVATDDGAPAGEMTDPSIPDEEQHFVRRMLEEIFAGRPPGEGRARITPALVRVMHEIDEHPERARIIEALRNPTPGSSPPEGDMAAQLRAIMQSVDMRAEYERLGITPGTEPAERPFFPIPVQGRIVNHTDLLHTNKEAAFSVDVTSRDTPPLMMTVPWVRVQWVVRRTNARETSAPVLVRGGTQHRHMLEEPERFTHAFTEVGTYEINAVVSLDNYLPNHFTIFCEVRTENERFAEIQDRSFTPGAWGDVDEGDGERRDLLGTSAGDVDSEGRIYEGNMPIECDPDMPVPGSLDAIDRRITQVTSMRDSGRLDANGVAWASAYLTSLNEARTRITSELSRGWRTVTAEGAYLSRAEGATSTGLRVVATAHHDEAGWMVAIHDMTQAFDARNSRFDGDEGRHATYRAAAEYTFTQMCKAYPRGRMAFRIELLHDTTGEPTGRFVGFEGECDSTWEAVHRVAYNPVVSAVINIAGTCVALFVPPAAPFIIPTLIAYNAVDTIGTVVDLGAREALTLQDVTIAAAQVAIDLIPYVGRATRIIRIGSRAYHVMEGLETAGEIVLMTAQAQEQVQSIRMGIVRQAAEVHARITELEASNPSDPELPRLRADFARMQQEATDAWATVGREMALQQGLMRMAMRTLHGIHEAHTTRVAEARTALTGRVETHGGDVITPTDRQHVQDVFGVRVGTWEGGGNGVRVAFDVHPLGGISNVRLEVGPHATLAMVMHHEATLASLRRYEGVTGSLRNLLERVNAWTRGGGHIPPHTRAFEARFELQKLPPIIASLREELTSRPLDDAMRARIEDQIAHLQQQLETHARAFDDLAPGLGYVAAADTSSRPTPVAPEGGDASATMGTRPGEAPVHPHAPAAAPPCRSRPAGRSEAAHAALER